jgi:hypothetical protein
MAVEIWAEAVEIRRSAWTDGTGRRRLFQVERINVPSNEGRCDIGEFLDSGEEGGGEWAAIAYSVIGSFRLNGLDPVRYLTDIAPHLADDRFHDHATITPRAWAQRLTVAAA